MYKTELFRFLLIRYYIGTFEMSVQFKIWVVGIGCWIPGCFEVAWEGKNVSQEGQNQVFAFSGAWEPFAYISSYWT